MDLKKKKKVKLHTTIKNNMHKYIEFMPVITYQLTLIKKRG